jgi:Fic family protein
MANKITKKDVINMMLADENIKANETFVAFLEHELELLDKKAQKKGKSDEELAEVSRLRGLIVSALELIEKGTVSDIQKADSELADLSNQKVTALLKSLVEDGVVVRTVEKRKAVFTLV